MRSEAASPAHSSFLISRFSPGGRFFFRQKLALDKAYSMCYYMYIERR